MPAVTRALACALLVASCATAPVAPVAPVVQARPAPVEPAPVPPAAEVAPIVEAPVEVAPVVVEAPVVPAPEEPRVERNDAPYEVGMASFYADMLKGNKTASGERYHPDKRTCAHRTHPFGTILEVKSADTGRTSTCRVNDRGPWAKARVIDVSKKVAKELGMVARGVMKVRVRPARGGRRVNTQAKAAQRIVDADRAAASALAAVDERDPQTQLAALRALEALVDACATSGATVLAHEATRLLEERKDTMRAFHVERVERALEADALAGAHDEAIRVLDNAIVVVGDIDPDGGTVRTFRARLDDVKRGLPGKPRPFFARYLEHQKR